MAGRHRNASYKRRKGDKTNYGIFLESEELRPQMIRCA